MRFRRRRLPPFRPRPLLPEEVGDTVLIRGHVVPIEWAEWNAQAHMAGFDGLPKSIRDQINYAETPELGARPTRDLAQGIVEQAREDAKWRAIQLAKRLTSKKT